MSFKKALRGVKTSNLAKKISDKVGGVKWAEARKNSGHKSDAFGRYPYDSYQDRGIFGRSGESRLRSGFNEGMKYSMPAASRSQRSAISNALIRDRSRKQDTVAQYSTSDLKKVRANRTKMESRYRKIQGKSFKQRPAMKKQRLKVVLGALTE